MQVERDKQASHATIAIKEWMNGFKLIVDYGASYKFGFIIILVIYVALKFGHQFRHKLRRRWYIVRILQMDALLAEFARSLGFPSDSLE